MPPRRDDDRRRDERRDRAEEGPKRWGGVARRGAAKVRHDLDSEDRAAERERDRAEARHAAGDRSRPEAEWTRTDERRPPAKGRPPGHGGPPPEFRLPDDDYDRFRRAFDDRADKELARLRRAADAFRAERFDEARRSLEPLVDRAPDVPSLRELLGLTLYRLERWPEAIEQLEALHELTGRADQHPVLADAYRALGDHDRVEELWVELREESPAGDLVTEGRIVTAGSRADRGDLQGALQLLGAKGWKIPRRPKEHHLRRAYALADLRERAGDLPGARDLFQRLTSGGGFADAEERVAELG